MRDSNPLGMPYCFSAAASAAAHFCAFALCSQYSVATYPPPASAAARAMPPAIRISSFCPSVILTVRSFHVRSFPIELAGVFPIPHAIHALVHALYVPAHFANIGIDAGEFPDIRAGMIRDSMLDRADLCADAAPGAGEREPRRRDESADLECVEVTGQHAGCP